MGKPKTTLNFVVSAADCFESVFALSMLYTAGHAVMLFYHLYSPEWYSRKHTKEKEIITK